MKRRVSYQLLKACKNSNVVKTNEYSKYLYQNSMQLVKDMCDDIKDPLYYICIHSQHPQLYLDWIFKDKQKKCTLSIADPFDQNILQRTQKFCQQNNLKHVNLQKNESLKKGRWSSNREEFDAIISDLQMHYFDNHTSLLERYKDSLKQNGVILGTCFGNGTLKQLYWSYLMAQNQRSGGVSPKVLTFPTIGDIGHTLTTLNLSSSSIFTNQYNLQYQSAIDLLSLMQQMGQTGYLFGKRKGVYKDLLLAMLAIYQNQFKNESAGGNSSQSINQSISSTVEILSFIGWKYPQGFQNKLKRGTPLDSKNFVEQMRKRDPSFKHYRLYDSKDDPQQL